MLEREGFRYSSLVDIFDAGPTVSARRDDIATIRGSQRRRARIVDRVEGPPMLVSRDSIDSFRATRTHALLTPEEAEVGREAAEALHIAEGDLIRVAP